MVHFQVPRCQLPRCVVQALRRRGAEEGLERLGGAARPEEVHFEGRDRRDGVF